RQLNHSAGEAEKFYRELAARGVSVRVGMEATGYTRWFERLLAELGIEVWIGDAAKIKTKRVRKQKTDREDARLLLRLLREIIFLASGYQSGESGPATTAVAPASAGADAHAALFEVNGEVRLKKRLTEPTLLEISGNREVAP